MSLTNDNNNSHKQKRQTDFRRSKRNREAEHNDSGHSEEETDEFDETEEERGDSAEETTERGHKDRLDDTGTLHMPFWDTYDAINQLYLQVGKSWAFFFSFICRSEYYTCDEKCTFS